MANFYTEKLLLDIELASQIGITNAIVYAKIENILQVTKSQIDNQDAIMISVAKLQASLCGIVKTTAIKEALNELVARGYLTKKTYNNNATFYSLGSRETATLVEKRPEYTENGDSSQNLATGVVEKRLPINNRDNNREEKDIIINNNIQKEKEKMSLKELKELCKRVSPVLYQRHSCEMNADYRLAQIYQEFGQTFTKEEIEDLLQHANATYIVQPKYNKLDLAWVLNHHKQVLQAERIEERTRDKPKRPQRDYDEE